jgi:hypothetical protein
MSTILEIRPESRQAGKRLGYVIAIVVNLAMLIIVQNILEWGWLPFLTEEFADVVPWMSASLVVAGAVNVIYLIDDRQVVRSVGQIVTNLIGIAVTIVIYQAFPFDFSSYAFNWEPIARLVLILAIVGSTIGVLVESIKVISKGRDGEQETRPSYEQTGEVVHRDG